MTENLFQKIKNRLRSEYHFYKKRNDKRITINESINKNHIRSFLPSNPVIIDAGAHVGADSVEMYRMYSNATIHAFEPVPGIFEKLKRNAQKHKRINCYQLALSNKTGEETLFVSSGSSDGSSSLMRPKEHLVDHPDVFFEEQIKVKTITLDDWAAENKIERIDFLWLDMQGFELEMLKQSSIIFPTVQLVHMEISTRATYEGVPLYDEVKEWMISKGFAVEVEAIPAGWDMGNVLFVHKVKNAG